MLNPAYIFSALLVAGAITWALRALPFVMLAPLRYSQLLAYLGKRMPVGIMLILAVYTLQDTDVADWAALWPLACSLLVTIGLHLWRGQMIISIFGGTALYIALTSFTA